LQDSAYNLTFLSNALNFKSSKAYKEYMKWLAELMKSLEVSLEEMLKYFDSMEIVLTKELKEYIKEGIEIFKKSYLKEEDKLEKEVYSPEVNEFLEFIMQFKREEATKYIIENIKKMKMLKEFILIFFNLLYIKLD